MKESLADALKNAVSGMQLIPDAPVAYVPPTEKEMQLFSIKVMFAEYEASEAQRVFTQRHLPLLDRLRASLASDPESVIDELYGLVYDHSDVPNLYNYLFLALTYSGYHDEAAAVCVETHFRFPRYVFGFCNYLTLLDGFGRLRDADRLMKDVRFVQDIDPARDTFHVSEVTSFETVHASYLLNRGNLGAAKSRLEMLRGLLGESHEKYRFIHDMIDASERPKAKTKKTTKRKKK